MLENTRFVWRIRKSQKRARDSENKIRAEINAAREAKDHDRQRELEHDLLIEREVNEMDIRDKISRHLREQSERLLLPWPTRKQDDPDWEEFFDGYYQLKIEALAELRARIRQEKKERNEQIFRWLGMLIGIVGAVTGLIAVITR